MASRSIFVTWPMEAEARAILERIGTVRASHTEHGPPLASPATRLRMATRIAENCVVALEGRRPPNLVNPEAWRSA
jgi:hypothetical protein